MNVNKIDQLRDLVGELHTALKHTYCALTDENLEHVDWYDCEECITTEMLIVKVETLLNSKESYHGKS